MLKYLRHTKLKETIKHTAKQTLVLFLLSNLMKLGF